MTNQVEIIKAKRVNIILIFVFSILFLIAGYLLANSLINRFENSLGEFQPIAKNINAALGESGVGVKQLSKSGSEILTKYSTEIPILLKQEYKNTGDQLSKEYQGAKAQMIIDYAEFKNELSLFKNKINTDIAWFKSETDKWRTLILIISTLFAIVMTLTSIQEIIANLRWLLTFLGFYKEKIDTVIENNS